MGLSTLEISKDAFVEKEMSDYYSFMLYKVMLPGYLPVTLDYPIVLSLAKEEPSLFMQRFRPPVLIDEIQYAPELLPYIKMEADKEQMAGFFWITGPQQFHLMKGISESLAGRVGNTF